MMQALWPWTGRPFANRPSTCLGRRSPAPTRAPAERLKVTPSTLTRIVDRLDRQGLVRRESDHGDRRLVRHHLSAKGARAVEELERGARTRMNEVMDRLTTAQLERVGAR